MPPITVDPNALSGAGEAIGAVGEEIATAISALDSALPGGAKSGLDPAGLAFGQTYQQLSQALLDAGAEAVNAGRSTGFGVRMSATNYSRADAASTIGGGESTVTPPDAPAEYSAPAAPSGLGGGVPPPLLWSVIQTVIPDVWPDGDPTALRASATAWQGFASTINGIVGHLTAPSGVVAGQKIPEGGQMTSAISKLTESLSKIASEAGNLATQTKEFADDVENTQNAIRDLMDRVSPSGLWDGITSVFTGDALEELKEVADDIKTVLGDYWRQAEGRRDILQIAMGKVDDAIVSVEKWARREFPRYLGEDVGNALATALDFELTLGQGILAGGVDLVEGIGQFDPTRFAYDPEGATQAWGDLAKSLGEGMLYSTPTGVLLNPGGAVDHWKDKVSDAVHAEDWSSDRSGFGLGKILFDVGASAVPGGPALRTTKVAADAAGDAAGAARRVDLPSGSFDNLTSATQRVEGITQNLENLPTNTAPEIPTTATPNPSGPPIPPSLVDAPSVGDTPTPTPRGPDAPAPTPLAPDAPTPHVPDSTPADRAPVPQSSTPTSTPGHAADAALVDRTPAGTPAHAPAADVPASGQHSAPTPAPSSTPSGGGTPSPAPAMAGHAPEPASVAAHAQPSASAGHAPEAATPPSHPDSHGAGSGGGSGDSGSGGNTAHEFARTDETPTHPDTPNGPHSGDDSHQPEDKSDDRPESIPPEDIPPPLVRETPYETGGIQPEYVGEQYPGGPMGEPGVTYLDEVAREQHRITISDGLVYDARGNLFDTQNGVSAFGPSSNGRAIFVMDEHGNLYASTYQAFREFHHSSLLGGQDVAAAGELVVKDGRIELITDRSGHYMPDRSRTQQVLDQLESQGIVIDPNNITFFAPPGT